MRRQTEERMTRLVRAWRTSGEPQARFARRHGVRPWTLWYWSQKVQRRPTRRSPSAAFVPVEVVADTPRASAAIEVVLVTGERLVVPEGVASTRVRELLAALRAAC